MKETYNAASPRRIPVHRRHGWNEQAHLARRDAEAAD